MIISASRRTDIPAFFAGWFMNRIREGYCLTPHPFNRKKIHHVSLAPETVEVIVFWTKNPGPLLPFLAELDRRGFRYYFLFTLNDYPALLEPKLPSFADRLSTFKRLAGLVGPARVIWRYDPIIISNHTTWDDHRQTFARLTAELTGHTNRVMVSLVEYYAKTRRRLQALAEYDYQFDEAAAEKPATRDLLRDMADLARAVDLETMICASATDWSGVGFQPGRCIDGALIERLWGLKVNQTKDKGQRKACGCAISQDIGVADTCRHDCPYCYATISEKAARANQQRHRLWSPAMVETT